MVLSLGSVKLYFGPTRYGAKDDLLEPIIETIDDAQSTIDIATQQLESTPIVDALIRASRRGVRVRVVLERDYLMERISASDPWKEEGINEVNRQVLSVLFRSRINVRMDRTSRLLHSNFIITDADLPYVAVLISTSANLSQAGLERHLNHLLMLCDGGIAEQFEREFESLWQDEQVSPHTRVPFETEIESIPVKAVFGPEHAPEMEVMKQIAKAVKSVSFSVFSFSRASGIDDTLILAANAGIEICGVLDGNQANHSWAATHNLVDAGIQLHISEETEDESKLHHKLLVVDDTVIVIGTFNFSRSGRFNEETLIILGHPNMVDSRCIERQVQLTKYARTEIERIIEDNASPFEKIT